MKLADTMTQARSALAALEAGRAARTAAQSPTDGIRPSDISLKDNNGNGFLRGKQTRWSADKLAKQFDGLARKFTPLRHLGSDKVLDNPREYFSRRYPMDDPVEHRRGQFVVKDAELETIIQTMLLTPPEERTWLDEDDMRPQYDQITGWQKGWMEALRRYPRRLGEDAQFIQRALDAASGAPLIRTDLDPILYEAFLRDFPALDEFEKKPANGILHTWNQRTAPGTAVTISDLGDMSAAMSNSTIGRLQTSHIATIIAPRAIGLKFQYAVQQSGMNYNVAGDENLEIVGAMIAIAKKVQSLILQGNYSVPAGTLNDENGLYDANAFDGMRYLLQAYGVTMTTGEKYVDAINHAVGQIINAGGNSRSLLILISLYSRFNLNLELMNFLRINDRAPAAPGFPTTLASNGLIALSDWTTKLLNIPADAQGNGIGYYTFSAASTEDIYVLDMSTWAIAYLGSPTPSILELPIGFNNQLSRVYYPFYMPTLVPYIAQFNRKLRAPSGSV